MSEFKDKVNEIVGTMVKDSDGKWSLPEGTELDEATEFAVTSERRFRDTQGAFTKAQQEAKRQEAIAAGLQEHVLQQGGRLTKEQTAELRDLKASNPEAWRVKLNEYEAQATSTLKSKLATIAQESSNKSEVEIRSEQMAAWSESTGIELTDAVVDNELPPKFKKELEAGTVTFDQFLEKAGNFLKGNVTIKGADDNSDDPVDLGKLPGGHAPSDKAQEGDFDQSYENTMF